MVIDKDKLRENLSKKYPEEIVDDILIVLRNEGLPLKVGVSKLDLKMGEDVSINFLNNKAEIPSGTDVLMKYNWYAKIGDINPMQIKSITIPTLNYTDNGAMTIDIIIYPFKIENIFKKKIELRGKFNDILKRRIENYGTV